MKFIDEATILVEAGHGGSGIKSFYREKFVPLGGPDGGNGGRGGSVILVATSNLTTLLDFHFQPRWKATDGLKGQGSRKDGKAGDDLVIKVPVGTQVYKSAGFDEKKEPILGELVCDFDQDGATFTLAQGGRGGKGNSFFKSPTNRAPEHFQPGEDGESGEYVLSLKLVADVGLVGLPNAGKSTLISRISAARPKIADYPFTTLTPNLGVVQAKGGKSFVVADIPGLIPGAHQGKGLGIKFLKHVERTKVIAHLIDPSQLKDDGSPFPPLEAWEAITNELRLFSPEIAERPQIVVLTKKDTSPETDSFAAYKSDFEAKGLRCLQISAVTGEGLDPLIAELSAELEKAKREDAEVALQAQQRETDESAL